MENIIIKKVQDKDIFELIKISINSFHSDYEYGAPNKIGGPPGYNSEQFHKKMIRISKAFYKILINEKIIGGFFIFDKGNSHFYLGRIFVDPDYHRNGYGARSMRFYFTLIHTLKNGH
jgi:RimJ/RimL family protein N-acetyltransferase